MYLNGHSQILNICIEIIVLNSQNKNTMRRNARIELPNYK